MLLCIAFQAQRKALSCNSVRLKSCCWRFAVPLALRKMSKFQFHFTESCHRDAEACVEAASTWVHKALRFGAFLQLSVDKRRCAGVATVDVC